MDKKQEESASIFPTKTTADENETQSGTGRQVSASPSVVKGSLNENCGPSSSRNFRRESQQMMAYERMQSLPPSRYANFTEPVPLEPPAMSYNASSWQSLLDAATTLTSLSAGVNTEPAVPVIESLSAERKNFFLNFLSQSGISESDLVRMNIDILKMWTRDTDDVAACYNALEAINSVIDDFDIATAFMKMGGFDIVGHFVVFPDPNVVVRALEILGTAAQNHILCQNAFAENSTLMDQVVDILNNDASTIAVKKKALLVISSVVQNNEFTHERFMMCNGYIALLSAFETGDTALKIRTCWTVNCLAGQFVGMRGYMLDLGFLKYLTDVLLSVPFNESKEDVLDTLITFTNNFYDAIIECNKRRGLLFRTIQELLDRTDDEGYFEAEKERASVFMQILNTPGTNDDTDMETEETEETGETSSYFPGNFGHSA